MNQLNQSIAWAGVGLLVVAMAGCGGKETPTENSAVSQGAKGTQTSQPAATPAADPAVANNAQQNAAPANGAAQADPQQNATEEKADSKEQMRLARKHKHNKDDDEESNAPTNANAAATGQQAPAGQPVGAATPAPAAAQGGAAPLNLLSKIRIGGNDDDDDGQNLQIAPQTGGTATLPQPANNQGGAPATGKAAPNGTTQPGGIAAAGPVASGPPAALVPMVVPTKVTTPQQAVAVFSFQLLNRIQMRIAQEQGPISLPNMKGAPGNRASTNGKSNQPPTVNGLGVIKLFGGGDEDENKNEKAKKRRNKHDD